MVLKTDADLVELGQTDEIFDVVTRDSFGSLTVGQTLVGNLKFKDS